MVSKANSLAPPCFGPLSAADAAGDGGVHVRAGAGDHARGEGRSVEFVLGVQDERGVHGAHPQLRGPACRAAGAGNGRRSSRRRFPRRYAGRNARSGTSTAASSRSSPSGGRRCCAPPRSCDRAAPAAPTPSAEQPVRSTSIGWVLAGMHSRMSWTAAGRPRSALQLLLVGRQLGDRRQLPVHQQVGDLLELRGLGEVEDVVAAVVQVVALAPDRAQRGVAGGHAGQRDRLLRLRSDWQRPGVSLIVCVPLRTARSSFCSYSW